MSKLVDTKSYHVWTDALHARALVQQTKSEWDRSTYCRWAIVSAWTAFEIACEDATGASGLGIRFKEKLDTQLQGIGAPRIDWGQGIWQRIQGVYRWRKDIVHVGPVPLTLAEVQEAISVLRDGVTSIYSAVGKQPPQWQFDDTDSGHKGGGSSASATVLHNGVASDDPNRVDVCYVSGGKERRCAVMPSGADWRPELETLRASLRVETTALRVYAAGKLIHEERVNIRGS